MIDDEWAEARAERRGALAAYRAHFDRALAEIRAATDNDDDGYAAGPVRAREEVARAGNIAEREFWRAWTAAQKER